MGAGVCLVAQVKGAVLHLSQDLGGGAAGGGVGLGPGHHTAEEEVRRLQLGLVELRIL